MLALVLAAAAAATTPTPTPPAAPTPVQAPSTPKMYDDAIETHGKGDHAEAAAQLFQWLAGAPKSSENYDLAQHLLAEDLASLGLYHAAIAREVAVARNRARPELLPEALTRLERWSDQVPSDENRILAELLHETDFGSLDGAAGAWVAYEQGALDLKAGNERWASQRFAQIPESSPYNARAKLLLAARQVGQNDADALTAFETIAADEKASRDARNDARIQAARLRYEKGDYKEALALYESIDLPELDPGRGQLYLEQAWTLYRLGDGSRAMGLLAALDAPSFRHLFLPDKHLLRAFIFKDACHLLSAKSAARELSRRFRVSLEAIQQRKPLTDDAVLSAAAFQKGAPQRIDRFLNELLAERDRLNGLAGWFSRTGLARQLAGFYAAAIAEAQRQRQLELEKGVEHAADELLHAAEQVGLLDYEVGLALYRRDRGSGPHSDLVFDDDEPGPGEVAFEFDGEYWNDELLEYRFHLTNRCAEGVTQ